MKQMEQNEQMEQMEQMENISCQTGLLELAFTF